MSPSPPVDVIWAMMIVRRIRGKIIGTVLCCVVYDNCAQCYAHTHEQFLIVGLGFFRFRCRVFLFRFCVVCFCCVRFSFFSTKPRDWLGRASLKWPILGRVGRKTLTQSVSWLVNVTLCCGLFSYSVISLAALLLNVMTVSCHLFRHSFSKCKLLLVSQQILLNCV